MRPRDTGASRRFTRWIPAIAAPIAIGAAVVLVPLQANAAVDLPDLTPEELVEFAASSDVEALSGTVEQTSELGLPDLAGLTGAMGGAGSSGAGSGDGEGASASDLDDLIDLATGSHTARVYLDGSNARMQVLDRLAERDVVRHRGRRLDLRLTRAGGDARHRRPGRPRGAPDRGARRAAMTSGRSSRPSSAPRCRRPTRCSTRRSRSSTSRPTCPSAPTPVSPAARSTSSCSSRRTRTRSSARSSIAIDGENGVPLAASVTARGAEEPAFSIAFTDVSFEAPDASVFEFTPPEGTTVTEHEVPVPTVAELEQWKADAEARPRAPTAPARIRVPQVIGEGWSAVVVLPAGEGGAYGQAADGAGRRRQRRGLGGRRRRGQRPRRGIRDARQPHPAGRRRTPAARPRSCSVFFADDGRVLVGAVTPERLLDAAASGR